MTQVEEFLEDLRTNRGALFPTVARLRAMALACAPTITEELKYGGILFTFRTPFCGVFAYRDHVTLEFSEGSALADPYGLLMGNGKIRRHIKLEAEHDIDIKHVASYLQAACAANVGVA
jgi:hypothetical protein